MDKEPSEEFLGSSLLCNLNHESKSRIMSIENRGTYNRNGLFCFIKLDSL